MFPSNRGLPCPGRTDTPGSLQRRLRRAVLAGAFPLLLAGCATGPADGTAPTIGAIFDLSGAQSSLDQPASRGMQLANAEAWQTMGAPPKLALEDGYSNAFDRKAAAETLAGQGLPVVAGFTDNNAVLDALPVLRKAGIPFVSVGATGPTLPARGGPRVFLAAFGDNAQAAVAAEYAVKHFGPRAVILYDGGSDYTRNLRRYFTTRFQQLGGRILLDSAFTRSPGSLQALGRRIARLPQKPDFVYFAAMPAQCGRLIAALRQAGVTVPIVGGDGLDTPELLAAGPLDNVYFTTHAFLDAGGPPRARAFARAYQTHFRTPPPNAFAALGYDTYRLLAQVLRTARTPDEITAALENVRGFQGVTGTISYGPGVRVPRKEVTLVRVRGGAREFAGQFLPESVPQP